MTKVAKKNPLKPLQMSIMAILRRKIAAWEKLNPWAVLKVVGGRIANEILMYFRSQRKLQSEVSLSDTIETDGSGDALYFWDVVGADDTMLSDLQDKENCQKVRRAVAECLDAREADIIRRRYGLDGFTPQTQRQVAAHYGISRSYVSRLEKRALEKLEQAIGEI